MSVDPTPRRVTERPGWLVATVLALIVMIVWTLVIKYLSPLVWFWSERLAGRDPDALPVMWDFWPVAHAVLATALWRRSDWARPFGLAIAGVEVAVVVGPVFDPAGAYGMAVVEAADEAAAKALGDNDPVVRAGLGFAYSVASIPSIIMRA